MGTDDDKGEPAKAEPAKAEPAKAEPAKAGPAKAGPAKAEPAEPEPAGALMESAYRELRAVAGAYFRSQPDAHTLQPTALVHEAFLRLARTDEASFRGREHFFAVAATAMRQILTSHARKRRAQKRGGGQSQVTLTNLGVPDSGGEIDLVALDDVLTELERLSPRQARVVEYRFFGGLTVAEIASVLEVSVATVEKDWRRARAWLAAELGS